MIAIEKEGQILIFNELPKTWENTLNYPLLDPSEHYDDGWRDFVIPPYNPQTQKLGEKYFDEEEDVYTYAVENKTIQEIQDEQIIDSLNEKNNLIQERLKAQIETEAQQDDDDTALNNQAIYPIWKFPFYYELDFKCQHFNEENELVLYKCIQPHESQENWKPKDFPALFVRVAKEGEILDWIQPIGAHDAYQTGDKVKHLGEIWISDVDNNVWEPGVYGWSIYTE